MLVQCREISPRLPYCCVFSSSDDYPNKLMVHFSRQGEEMYTEAEAPTDAACSCSPKKKKKKNPIFASRQFELSLVFTLTLTLLSPRWKNPFCLKNSSRQTFRQKSFFFFGVCVLPSLPLLCALHSVDCFVCPSRFRCSVVLIWVSLQLEFLLSIFFIYISIPQVTKPWELSCFSGCSPFVFSYVQSISTQGNYSPA